MRILDVSPRVVFPPERGSSVRVSNLLRHLSSDHEIRQFSQASSERLGGTDGTREAAITPHYRELRYSSRLASLVTELGVKTWVSAPVLSGLALRLTRPESLRRLLAWADVVLVEFPWQFDYCRRLAPSKPLVLASHNVEASKFRSYAEACGRPLSTGLWLRRIRAAEARAVARADLVLAVSAADAAELVATYRVRPERVVEIRNGIDTAAVVPATAETRAAARSRLGLPDRATVVFAGADVPPNRAGLEWVLRLARRSDRFTFVVVGEVGRRVPAGSAVTAPGFVDDMAPWLHAADVALCPIEFGGGTKIKLLEALAAGLPTVAFSEALHGLALTPGEHVLVADKREDALLAAVGLAADDADLARRLGLAGRSFVVAEHDSATIARTLGDRLSHLVGVSPERGATPSPTRGE